MCSDVLSEGIKSDSKLWRLHEATVWRCETDVERRPLVVACNTRSLNPPSPGHTRPTQNSPFSKMSESSQNPFWAAR